MAEMLLGRCFMVYQGDSPIAAYVLRGQGNEVWVQAGAGRANVDLCDVFDDLIVQHAAGFESVAFRTYRRGFVKKALQRGYQVADESDGYTMRKKLK